MSSASYERTEVYTESTVRAWTGGETEATAREVTSSGTFDASAARVQLSAEAWTSRSRPRRISSAAPPSGPRGLPPGLLPGGPPGLRGEGPPGQARRAYGATPATVECEAREECEPPLDGKLNLLRSLVEQLTGRKVEIFRMKQTEDAEVVFADAQAVSTDVVQAPPAEGDQAPRTEGWGIEVRGVRVETRFEGVQFQAEGSVRTEDGRVIDFAAQLEMQRASVEVSRFELRAGDAALKDPLVLNFDGVTAELSGPETELDLDQDGQLDSFAFVGAKSAFLYLDRDGSGDVTDGSELFGATTGDGFAELAELDIDGNGWIDEGDAAFDDLSLWFKEADGTDRLVGLAEAGVGAIALANAQTAYELQSDDGEMAGKLQATGVYLQEDGMVGTVQHVDVVATPVAEDAVAEAPEEAAAEEAGASAAAEVPAEEAESA